MCGKKGKRFIRSLCLFFVFLCISDSRRKLYETKEEAGEMDEEGFITEKEYIIMGISLHPNICRVCCCNLPDSGIYLLFPQIMCYS